MSLLGGKGNDSSVVHISDQDHHVSKDRRDVEVTYELAIFSRSSSSCCRILASWALGLPDDSLPAMFWAYRASAPCCARPMCCSSFLTNWYFSHESGVPSRLRRS